MLRLQAGENGAVVDPSLGNIPDLWFGALMPLHKAPWYGAAEDLVTMPAVERRLAGDFLCMPFGKSDVTGDPIHGRTANCQWQVVEREAHRLRLRLDGTAMGARVEKEIRIGASAPLLYQTHVIEGGSGRTTLAHHPMVRMVAGGRLSFSPKRAILTPNPPMDPGSSIFPPGLRTETPDDPRLDLTRYPSACGEDFVTLVEAPGSRLGWTAVVRAAENDIVFVLKDPQVLPVTMLWISNGGRRQPPWHGRHVGVLGIEDGIAAGAAGHRASLGDNPVRAEGVETTLELGPRHVVRHVIGAVKRPAGWSSVTSIRRESGHLILTGDTGEPVRLNFAAGFL